MDGAGAALLDGLVVDGDLHLGAQIGLDELEDGRLADRTREAVDNEVRLRCLAEDLGGQA